MPTVRKPGEFQVANPTKRRRPRPPRTVTYTHLQVTPEVMAAAKAARRPGEKLVIVSESMVRLVPDGRP